MRLAELSYEQLSPEQKMVWDEVVAGPRKKMHGPSHWRASGEWAGLDKTQ